jgi:hypothetical protein
MKNFLFITAILFGLNGFAQSNQTCYQKYAKVFEIRGANSVSDGTHDNIILTIRKGSFADCFIGKVKVNSGAIDLNSIYLSYVDDSFEPFRRSYKSVEAVTIINGMSKTMITEDDELINVMFVDAIKPKKKALKKAPEPDFDL